MGSRPSTRWIAWLTKQSSKHEPAFRDNSFLKISLAFLLLVICLGGDAFFERNYLSFFFYFTFLSFIVLVFLLKTDSIRVPPAILLLIFLTGIYFCSILWSVKRWEAEITVVLLLTGFLSFFIFSNSRFEKEDILFFLKLIVIATSFQALWGILQGLLGYKFLSLHGFAAHGTLYNPNSFSGFLGMVYPMALFIFIQGQKKGWLLPVGFIFLANLLSLSRVGIGTLLLTSLAALIFLFYRKDRSSLIKLLLTLLLSVFTYSLLVLLRGKLFDLTSEVSLLRDPILVASTSRFKIWVGTLPMIFHHPFFGVGLRSFEDFFKHFNDPQLIWPRPHAHNLFLHITSEIGTIGFLFLIGFIFMTLSSALKQYKKTGDSQAKLFFFLLLLALSGFLFNNLVEYNWEHPVFQVLFYFMSSLALAGREWTIPLSRIYKMILSGSLTLFFIFYVGFPSLGHTYLDKAKVALAQGDERGLDYLIKASTFNPYDSEPYLVLSLMYEGAWVKTKKEAFLQKAIGAKTKAAHLSPMDPGLYLDLGKLLEKGKRREEARACYEKAMDIDPYTLKYREALASFLLRKTGED